MADFAMRPSRPGDEPGAYHVCLKTGDYGEDGERIYRDDPDALGRIYVGPYLAFEPEHCVMLEDAGGICGYALGAFDSRQFYARYEADWRPTLCAAFPKPSGDSARWSRLEHEYHSYHCPDYFCPDPYSSYPSHVHIDLLPRAQRQGHGRQLLERVLSSLAGKGSPGVHLGVSTRNQRAFGFYERLGFRELVRTGTDTDGCIYMGIALG